MKIILIMLALYPVIMNAEVKTSSGKSLDVKALGVTNIRVW